MKKVNLVLIASTETIKLIRDGEKRGRGYGGEVSKHGSYRVHRNHKAHKGTGRREEGGSERRVGR